MMGKQLGFYYNQNYCIGCQACETACKNKNKLDVGMRWRIVDHFEATSNGRQADRYISHSCMHCEKPNCAAVCPVKAYKKRPEDGIVVLDYEKCTGCGACVNACPYQAVRINRKELKASKCDLCLDYQQQGELPACIRGCPLQVLKFGDIKSMEENGAVKDCLGFQKSITGPAIRFAPEKG
ncbi:MAG TPA: 4Fe-4S dicluster domain-containing protein [Negativicutes bacterium]